MLRLSLIALLLSLTCSVAWAADAKPLNVALLCTGSTTDGGWNQLASDGITKAAKAANASVIILQKVAQDRAAGAMLDFAGKDFDLIIAHGYEYLNPATDVAIEAPNTAIVVCGADLAKPNIMTIDFDVSHASYQAGLLAAQVSQKQKFGFIGGAPIPSVKACYRGFLAGVRSINPAATVAETYTSWDQPQQNKAQTEALLQQGCDIIYHDVDAASLGVFEAIAAANATKDGSAWVIGCVADQNANPICPNYILGSAVIRLDETFVHILASVAQGTFSPGLVQENLARKTCVFIPNPTLFGTVITDDLQRQLAASELGLIDGSIVIPAE